MKPHHSFVYTLYYIFREREREREHVWSLSMQCIYVVLYYHLWTVWLHHIFPHYLINGMTLRGKKKSYWTKMCVLIFSTTFVCNISHSKKDWVKYLSCMYIAHHVKYLLSFSNFNKTLIFATDVRKIPKHQISWKFTLWQPSCSMQTDGQTDRRDEANNHFSQFC